MASALQQKLQALLQATSTFFVAHNATPDQDRKSLDQLRELALGIAAEAGTPTFERATAYVLGGVISDAHYPLQCVRMLFVTALALRDINMPVTTSREDVLWAAFLSDLGFRAVWLSSQGAHSDLTSVRLKGLNLPWFGSSLEAMTAYHHNPAKDPSPLHILSIVSEYLMLVYGTGVDEAPLTLLSPTKAVETLSDHHRASPMGVKCLLKALSAYPLGSWVRLNTGDVGFVVGSNRDNPLRPLIGMYKASDGGQFKWHEWSIAMDATVHVAQELIPTPIQQAFVDAPFMWIPGWEGRSVLTQTELQSAFAKDSTSSPATTAPNHPMVEHVMQSGSTALPSAAPRPSESLNPRVEELRSKTEQEELGTLRDEWKRYAEEMESAIKNLKDGLLESYRRENQQYKAVLGTLSKSMPPEPPPPAVKSSAPSAEPKLPTPPSVQELTAPAASAPPPKPSGEPAQAAPRAAEPSRWRQLQARGETAQKQLDTLRERIRPVQEECRRLVGTVRSSLERLLATLTAVEVPLAEKPMLLQAQDRLMRELTSLEMSILDPARLQPRALDTWDQIAQFLTQPEDAAAMLESKTLETAFARAHDALATYSRDLLAATQALRDRAQMVPNLLNAFASYVDLYYLQKGLERRHAGRPAEGLAWFAKITPSPRHANEAKLLMGLTYLFENDPRAVPLLEQAAQGRPSDERLKECAELARQVLGSKEAR